MLKTINNKLLHKEAKKTVLSLLKNFYDEETFNILIKEFYDSDIEISLAAINASSSIGNEIAIPHLYKLIEKGKQQQKLASIKALAAIRAPSSINMLVKYYKLFQDEELRTEILKAVNDILPFDRNVVEMNRAVLLDAHSSDEMKIHAIRGMIETGELDFIKDVISQSSPEVRREAFKLILNSRAQADKLLNYFHEKVDDFTPYTLGVFLTAYLLKTERPQHTFLIEKLQNSDHRVFTSFIQTLSEYGGDFSQPTRVFRLLMVAPFIDFDVEAKTGDQIKRMIEQIKAKSPHLLNELTVITLAHLETVFVKSKKNYISLKGITERETLLSVVFANILERYANRELLQKVQNYFKSQLQGDANEIIFEIKKHLRDAPPEDKYKFEACLSLFKLDKTPELLNLVKTLSNINFERPNLLRRLNRLVRVSGYLKIRNSIKRLNSILQFAREERITFLTETLLVTLLELLSKSVIDQARRILSSGHRNISELRGVIRGSRFIPPNLIVASLLHFLILPDTEPELKTLALDTLKHLKINEVRGAVHSLINAVKSNTLTNEHRKLVGEIVASQGDSSNIQSLIDLTTSSDDEIKKIAISSIREISRRIPNAPTDIITNRLYILLEDDNPEIRNEALLGLIALNDDYAFQVLRDSFQREDGKTASFLIRNIQPMINHEILSILLEQVVREDEEIQEALREVLNTLCRGEMAEEIRNHLINTLKVAAEGKSTLKKTEPKPAEEERSTGILEHAKLEFKFKRENSQILTVMFIDIVGYTEKSSSTDMTDIIELIQNFESITLPLIKNYKGTLIKKMGDGLLAVFKHPLNAVLAALAIQKKISEYNELKVESEKFQARIGLNTGLVIRKDDDIYGDVVNVASRMETSANPGDILLTQATYEQIKDYIKCTKLGNIQVKGKHEPIPAYSAVGLAMDISSLLKKKEEHAAVAGEKAPGNGITHFKESLFNPKYEIPANIEEKREILEKLSSLFTDLTTAIEEIAQNYHEEYIFKRYLQNRWNDLLESLKST